jgi:hypothetical protein
LLRGHVIHISLYGRGRNIKAIRRIIIIRATKEGYVAIPGHQ